MGCDEGIQVGCDEGIRIGCMQAAQQVEEPEMQLAQIHMP